MKTLKNKIAVALSALFLMGVLAGCNKTFIDTTYAFDYAYVELPNGTVVEGKVQSWKDFDDGDQIQVTIDGKTYLTNSTRVVLVPR